FYGEIAAGGVWVEDLTTADWERVVELLTQYADLNLDAADASVIAIAERLNQPQVATLDQRDYRVVRPRHVDAFDLLPSAADPGPPTSRWATGAASSGHSPEALSVCADRRRTASPVRLPLSGIGPAACGGRRPKRLLSVSGSSGHGTTRPGRDVTG